MKVITEQEFAKATKLDKVPFPGLTTFFMELTKINEVNTLLSELNEYEGIEFIDKVLQSLNIRIDLNPGELKNIPAEGAFIAIANHPYGGIEGLILLKILCSVRPETKLMANFLLQRIQNVRNQLVAVNPFESVANNSSISGLRYSLHLLLAGVPLAVFPAGEVSSFKKEMQQVTDKQWHPVAGKLIRKANVPVLPIYFLGNNGILFNILGLIHPALRTAKLPSELFNKRGHVIKVRIGKPISGGFIESFKTSSQLLEYLRARTYLLGANLEGQKKILKEKNLFKVKKKPDPLISAIPVSLLKREIENLQSDSLIHQEKNYNVFVAKADKIPYVLREIGRLREQTFREVGEGTNKPIDLDKYDIYYYHLFIWDKEAEMLVGAYRIGKGDEILYSFGKKGFYIAELFKVKAELSPLLGQSLELGRSWVRKEYQQKALPLFLLWKGIMKFLANYPNYNYLIGPVSISNHFSDLSKSLMVDYIRKNHFDEELAAYVKPRKRFKVDFTRIDGSLLLENKKTLKDADAKGKRNMFFIPTIWLSGNKNKSRWRMIRQNISAQFN